MEVSYYITQLILLICSPAIFKADLLPKYQIGSLSSQQKSISGQLAGLVTRAGSKILHANEARPTRSSVINDVVLPAFQRSCLRAWLHQQIGVENNIFLIIAHPGGGAGNSKLNLFVVYDHDLLLR